MTRCLLLAGFLVGAAGAPSLRVEPGKDPARVRVTAALPPELAKRLPAGKLSQDDGEAVLKFCVVDDETGQPGGAMLGNYERKGNELVLVPRFDLIHGKRYQAIFEPAAGKLVRTEYRVPARAPAPLTLVERVYPTADVLPANHLRFYVYFSRPMRGGAKIFEHFRILDADGKEIIDPWLHDELWFDGGRVLILYIHPGRIKWGLELRDTLGPVLVPDRRYTLVIGPGLLDADGRKLGKEYRKQFRTVAEDRVRLDLGKWKFDAPKAGTTEPLTVTFDKAIDHIGIQRRLEVIAADGKVVAGKVAVGAGERSCTFVPARPWQAAEYKLRVDRDLEDPCGNTPVNPFDVDLKAPKLPPQPLLLPFRPAAQPAAPALRRSTSR